MKNIILHADDFGRTALISKSIYECIKAQTINSISIIVSEKIHGVNYIKKNKVKKRLHINLTDFSYKFSNRSFLYNLSFIDLFFLPFLPNFHYKKKLIESEIDRQIRVFKKTFNKKKIFVDGHQHVHMIPWIFNLIYKKRVKSKITNIRIPNENFIINYEDLFKISILKNIIKYLVIKLFIFISYKKIKKINYNYIFFGIIYSGQQNIKYIRKVLKFKKKLNLRNKIELLLHPGFSSKKEKKFFKKNFFKYYQSNDRKKEFKLTLSLKKIIR